MSSGVAAIGHFRVNDHIEAMNAMGLGATQGGADAGHGVVQGAAQLEGGIGADDAGAGDNFQQTGGRAGAGQGGVTVRRRAGGYGFGALAGPAAVQPADFAGRQTFGYGVRGQDAFQAAQQGRQQGGGVARNAGGGNAGGSVVMFGSGHRSNPILQVDSLGRFAAAGGVYGLADGVGHRHAVFGEGFLYVASDVAGGRGNNPG